MVGRRLAHKGLWGRALMAPTPTHGPPSIAHERQPRTSRWLGMLDVACSVSPLRPHRRNGALEVRRGPMLRERQAPVRLATAQQVEQEGIEAIHDIFTQPLHFLVTDASQPVPGDLAIGADDF